MSPETIAEKSARYLVEGRLIVERVDDARVVARCRGRGHLYRLGWERGKGWWCTCPASGACSPLLALQLVVCEPEEAA